MFTIYANAKINLTLDVLMRRADGYHEVDMLLHSVTLCDKLIFNEDEAISLTVNGDAPANESNLILKTARLLVGHTGVNSGARIALEKRIPTAAGLGGGSADAAATLVGLNRLWGLSLPMDTLAELGARLGADVPFCLRGGAQRALGIGTELIPLPAMPDAWIVLCKPCEGMLTRDVYAALDRLSPKDHPDTARAIKALEAGDLKALSGCLKNVLETVTLSRRPEAAAALSALSETGALMARMSGSGPTVYGLFEGRKEAEAACERLSPNAWKAVVRPAAYGLEYE